jgi:hypothetical protein
MLQQEKSGNPAYSEDAILVYEAKSISANWNPIKTKDVSNLQPFLCVGRQAALPLTRANKSKDGEFKRIHFAYMTIRRWIFREILDSIFQPLVK